MRNSVKSVSNSHRKDAWDITAAHFMNNQIHMSYFISCNLKNTYHSEKEYTFLLYFPLLTHLQIFSRHFFPVFVWSTSVPERLQNPFLPRKYLIYSICCCLVSCFISFLFVSCLCQFFILHSAIIWYCALLILQVLFNLFLLVDCKTF